MVEDEADVGRLLEYHLEKAEFEVELAATGAAALLSAARRPPDVIVLDLMLPDLSGRDLCARLRADPALADVGVLMVTALGDDADRIAGLEAGADDYVAKPFNVEEVVLRVRALARRLRARSRETGDEAPLSWRELRVDPVTHEVTRAGEPLKLRPIEFKLLVSLLRAPGRVFSRDELLELVWESTAVSPRTVDVHVRRLRQALGDQGDVIETVSGFGYRARRD